MKIKNITDRTTPKVIGIGSYWFAPGEEKYIPNDFLYVEEVDKYGHETGKKIILPAITTQARLGMLTFEEDIVNKKKEPAKVKEEPVKSEEVATEETEEKAVEEVVKEQTPKKTKRAKKATTVE